MFFFHQLSRFEDSLEIIEKESYKQSIYYGLLLRTLPKIKGKVQIFFAIQLIICIALGYYLFVFSALYRASQWALIKNYLIGLAESMTETFIISLLVTLLRVIGIKKKNKYLYNTSKFINDKF